jgi:phospholipid/cholesterol/gamma-HCH transport system permease protein
VPRTDALKMNTFERIGNWLLGKTHTVGGMFIFYGRTMARIGRRRPRAKLVYDQMMRLGVESIGVVTMTALFTGMVIALQSVNQLKMFGAEVYVGGMVSVLFARELGPVLTSIMLAGRVGAAMAAELGTMRVTEQIDALETLASDPYRYLVAPRLIAMAIMAPVLTALAMGVAQLGSFFVCTVLADVDPGVYIAELDAFSDVWDIVSGLVKAFAFGQVLTLISCYYGFSTFGGAEGVGRSTTNAVVVSAVNILIVDVILTTLFFIAFD